MAILKEIVDKKNVFRVLRDNAAKDKKNVYITGIKDGEKFMRTYTYSPKRRSWFVSQDGGKPSKVKSYVPAFDVRDMFKKGYTFDTAFEGDDAVLVSFTQNSDIEESTTAASSGAYQTPFGGQTIKRKKMNENKDLVEITEQQFEEMVKKTLVLEYVYDSEAGKATAQNAGKTKSTAKEQTKKADANQKPNISDKETATYYNKSNPVARDEKKKEQLDTEARQNGQEDIVYANLPDKAKEQIKKGFEAGGEAGKKLLDQAKKRSKSKANRTKFTGLYNDVEVSPNQGDSSDAQPTVAESFKKYKLSRDYILTEEEDVERLLESKQKKLQGKIFFLEDVAGNLMKMDWSKQKANILSLTNPLREQQEKNKLKSLLSEQKQEKTVGMNENDYFKNFYNKYKES